jgi:hypothetical protein
MYVYRSVALLFPRNLDTPNTFCDVLCAWLALGWCTTHILLTIVHTTPLCARLKMRRQPSRVSVAVSFLEFTLAFWPEEGGPTPSRSSI